MEKILTGLFMYVETSSDQVIVNVLQHMYFVNIIRYCLCKAKNKISVFFKSPQSNKVLETNTEVLIYTSYH